MTGMLASVENSAEAMLVMEAGVDIIDLKSPSTGSLGALPLATVREIVHAVGGRCPLSATIGDLPMDPARVFQAAESMAGTGVDYVKVGLFPAGDWRATVFGLTPLSAHRVRLVAVLFGDLSPGLAQIAELALAGFSAVMLDTLDKAGGFRKAGTAESRGFTEERLAAGASMLRDMIWTAWLESAKPAPAPY